jgi:hypothetical protein
MGTAVEADLNQLKYRFEQKLTEETLLLGSGDPILVHIRTIASEAFGDSGLRLRSDSVSLVEDQSMLRLTGNALGLLGLENLAVEAVFFIDGKSQHIECIVAATLPNDWNFHRAFPGLAGYTTGVGAARKSHSLFTAVSAAARVPRFQPE